MMKLASQGENCVQGNDAYDVIAEVHEQDERKKDVKEMMATHFRFG
jgi:hypothetical protein